MSDEPTIVALDTIQTATAAEQNGAEWWVRIWAGEHSILLHPAEALLFAQQIRAAARRAQQRRAQQRRAQ